MNPNDSPRDRRNPESIEDLPEDERDHDLGAREPFVDRRQTIEEPVGERKTDQPGDDEEDIDG